ncbi:MAG: FAD-binding oxidoreductase [Elusimicrobia bacterium]|nr:FAD-binding oxidoreductase [Elusimicrobiota bacterium]
MSSPFAEIARVLGPARVLEDEASRTAASRDSWPRALGWGPEELSRHRPAAVLKPRDEKGLAAVLAWASAAKVGLLARGAGSGVLGAAIPRGPESAVLDASSLADRFELDPRPDRPSVTCGAGMLGSDLEAKLQAKGWSLMHFPQSMEDSTAGGWIATDSFGQLSTRYGGVADQALWVKAWRPDGTSAEEEPAPHLGAEGTLGILSEVCLRIRPAARSRSFNSFRFRRLAEALDFARDCMARPVRPSVLRLYCPVDAFFNGLRRRGPSHGSSRWMEAAEGIALRRLRLMYALSPLAGRHWVCVAVYEDEPGFERGAPAEAPPGADLGEGPAVRWWERRYHLDRERLERVFQRACFADTADLWAPWERLGELYDGVMAALRPHAFAFAHLSHFDAKGACLYVTLAGVGPEEHARAWQAAMEACVKAGGRVNHHHGVGLAKLPWLSSAKGPEWLASWSAQKKRRDPGNLLNAGKLCR